jgi:nucleoside phosphorylase/tetratricopeptide (TPR) repeat protein/dephospho-CoA kinase
MNMDEKNSPIDVLLITAVKDELDVVRNAEPDWQEQKDSKGFSYYTRKVIGNQGNEFTIAAARPIDMGGDFASNIATRLVNELKPRCLAMVGICAGWREKVFLGDVIVADRVFRYDSGKLKAFPNRDIRTEEFFHDIRTYNLKPLWVQKAQDFPPDWISTIQTKRPLSYSYQELWLLYAQEASESGRGKKPVDLEEEERKTHCPDWTEVLKRLEKKGLIEVDESLKLTEEGKSRVAEDKIWYHEDIPPDPDKPKTYVAPMGTGSPVQEDPELFPTIAHYMRKVHAVEMEAAAIGAVAEIENVDSCIIVKGVADYADPEKDDHFRFYAIEVSYRFLMAFLKENLILQSRKKVPFILPQLDVSYFTGREDELKRLEELLLKKEEPKICSIVGLTGSGGIGKSAVACHFAELHKADFPDGIIGLRVDGKDVDTIAREFTHIYGEEIEPDDTREASIIMQDVFRHRQLLLIFDNAIDSSIRSLLPGGNRCAVIITTRDRALPALLDTPQEGRIDIDILLDPDAMLLLERLLGKDRVDSERGAAHEIIKLVGNLPLGLEIVGATLQIETRRRLTDYAQSLREERDRLRKLKIRGDEHLDVRASFMLSLKLLTPAEIDFFSCLSVCAKDGFSLQAAMAATGCDEETAEETLAFLHRLSLLNYSQSRANRFVFHTLILLFAQELAVERSLQDIATERHAKFFIEFVKSNDLNDPSASHFVAEELEDILLAAEWLQSQNKADYELAIKLESFFQRYGHWRRALELMTGFLELAERIEDWNAAVQFRIQQAKYLTLCGEWQKAYEALNPISDIFGRIPDKTSRLHCEAMWLQRQGKFDEAVDAFQRSASIEEKLDNYRGLAMVLNSLGGVLQRQGKFDEAVDSFQRSAAIEEKLGNLRGQAMVLNSLGGVLQRQGKFDEAVDSFQNSAAIEEELGDRRGRNLATCVDKL